MCCASRSSETTATSPRTAYGAYSHWSHALIPSEDSKGVLPIAVFSRYPLANHRFITYQRSSNCSMMCDVVMDTDTIRLINNHLQTTSVSQKRRKWERELATDDTRREVQAAKDAAGTLHENFVKRTTQAYVISHYAKASPIPCCYAAISTRYLPPTPTTI